MVSTMDDDSKHCDIGRIDARDARSLSQRLRTPLLELFPALEADGWAHIVIKPSWNLRILVLLRTFRRHFLLMDVSLILSDNIDLLHYRRRQIVGKMAIMQMIRYQIGKAMGFVTDNGRQNAYTVGSGHQPVASIVLPQYEATFGARRKHAIRFICAFGDKIVNHHTNVRILTAQYKWFFTANHESGVYACHDSLRGSLLVASCAIYLSGEEKACYAF